MEDNRQFEYFERLLALLEYCFEYYGNNILPSLEEESFNHHYPLQDNDYNKD
jgi:hypothetical protein